MKYLKKATITFIYVVCFSLFADAQWYKLTAYTNPFANQPSYSVSYPILPYCAGNNVILYSGVASCPTYAHCGSENLMKSENDLVNCNSIFSGFGELQGAVFSISSKNDSTLCFIYSNASFSASGTYLAFTSNSFSTTFDTITLAPFSYGGPPWPSCFSNSFIYVVWQDSHYNDTTAINDSIVIVRNSFSLLNSVRYSNTNYVNPLQVSFTNDSTGFMLCTYANNSTKSVVAKTIDSGKIWRDSFIDSIHVITCFSFPTPSIGYITENNGCIYKTINGGVTWVKVISPALISLNCVSFSDSLLGYIGGNSGLLYKTINGGSSWTAEASNDTLAIDALYTFDSIAYFTDAKLNIYKNENLLTGIDGKNNSEFLVKVYPNPSRAVFNFQVQYTMVNGQSSVEVYNMMGENIYNKALPQTQGCNSEIDLSNQPEGIYLYRVISESGYTIGSGKLVIQ
jgi:hypothetical protein